MTHSQNQTVRRVSATTRHDGLRQAHVTWPKLTATLMLHVDELFRKSGICVPTSREGSLFPSRFVSSILSEVTPLTGEPDAGNPPVRFGGRGGRNQSAFPTPILKHSFGEYELIANSKKVKKTQNDAQKIGSSFRLQTSGRTTNGSMACAGRELRFFRASQIRVGKNSTKKSIAFFEKNGITVFSKSTRPGNPEENNLV